MTFNFEPFISEKNYFAWASEMLVFLKRALPQIDLQNQQWGLIYQVLFL